MSQDNIKFLLIGIFVLAASYLGYTFLKSIISSVNNQSKLTESVQTEILKN